MSLSRTETAMLSVIIVFYSHMSCQSYGPVQASEMSFYTNEMIEPCNFLGGGRWWLLSMKIYCHNGSVAVRVTDWGGVFLRVLDQLDQWSIIATLMWFHYPQVPAILTNVYNCFERSGFQ